MTLPLTSNQFAEIALDGSLLLAAPVAVLAGLVSFLSPCVLPLVPGYLGYVTGLTGADLREHRRGRVLAGVLLFVAGFSLVFISAGVLFSQVAAWMRFNGAWVTQLLGLVVILMGVVFMGGIGFLQRDRKIHRRPKAGLWGAPILGFTFGLGWAPCIGPTLSAVLIMSTGTDANVARGGLLTLFYCVGLGVPFILIALAMRRGLGTLGFFRQHQVAIMRFGGGMLILLGVVMATGLWGHWVAELQNWFANEVRLPI